jgi:hypothetical protein
MPRYLSLTNGDSRWVSWLLLGSESLAQGFASALEALNEPLASAGVNILCEDFVSMANTPLFRDRISGTPLPMSEFRPHRGWDDLAEFWQIWQRTSYQGLGRSVNVVIAELELVPTYHCMYRHILESIRRAALRADDQLTRADAQGLKSNAERLIGILVGSHIAILPIAFFIDELAAPVNARGIPLVCQDVPPIPRPQ